MLVKVGRCVMHWTKDLAVLFDPLRELAKHSSDDAVRVVMTEGRPELKTAEYDNWNGGTTYYSLVIGVPIPAYAAIEGELERVEGEILKRIERYQRTETHDFIREVLVQPTASGAVRVVAPTECKFWAPHCFRVFVSHLSENKKSANLLKTHLHPYGICAFVAHEDIEPTKEWREEIEKALFSMDAMAAILAPGFGRSKWTDHEVGIALGRGKIVLPILYGIAPYGLLGKYQGFQGKGKSAKEVSEAVFWALLENRQTSPRLVFCLVEQFLHAETADVAVAKLELLDRAGNGNGEYMSKIREKGAEFATDPVFLERVNQFLKKFEAQPIQPKAVSEGEEDIPF